MGTRGILGALILALAALIFAPPAAEALQELVSWTNPDPAAPGFVAATNIRVDSGPTPTTLVKGPLLPTTQTSATITAGLVLGQVTCTQVSWINGFGETPLFAAPSCAPAGGLATKGGPATIIFLP